MQSETGVSGAAFSPTSQKLRKATVDSTTRTGADGDNMSEFMGGVSIQQVKPISQKNQYASRPPKPGHETIGNEPGSSIFTKGKGKKTERRPTSSFINNAAKKRLN